MSCADLLEVPLAQMSVSFCPQALHRYLARTAKDKSFVVKGHKVNVLIVEVSSMDFSRIQTQFTYNPDPVPNAREIRH